ncbi:hypothetical protein [Lacrimispora indolis]|uniref:hypothetical protein n=1 Tax=Lacrimispora indolis TaxID=69825 RepID=UPI0003FAA653|nr:hypothetical protein [[Clostridium] methoxybenzovorans]
MKGHRNQKKPEYVVICREINKATGKVEITVIDQDVTDHLMNGLIKIHLRDPNKRYFLTLKKDYQVYGQVYKKQIEALANKNNKRIVELGIDLE